MLWGAGLIRASLLPWPAGEANLLEHGDAWARYLLYLPGSVFAALVLLKQARQLQTHNLPRPARDVRWAALGFGLNLFTGALIVPHLGFFPASALNYATFEAAVGLPVQVFRAASAIVVAFFVVRALRVFEDEHRLQIERAHRQLETLSALALSAQEAERKRVARELHDDTAQSLTSLLLRMKLLEKSRDSVTLRQTVRDLIDLTVRTLEGVRWLALQLRPADLDDLGLIPALERHADEVAALSGLTIRVEADGGDKRLPGELELAAYRIVQEALTNAVKHARATTAAISLRRSPDGLEVT
ncbi:MAG: hypothetical protein HY023_01130, partial [Chloroflexi bacterium]|nr:hypothetical protein [Chloroflexota bacterium]